MQEKKNVICLRNNPIFEKPSKFEKRLNKTLNRYYTYNEQNEYLT